MMPFSLLRRAIAACAGHVPAVAVAVLLTVLCGVAGAQNVKWHDVLEFEIEGRGWEVTEGPFDRLPDSAKGKVPGVAWELSKDSAGICVRFATDAQELCTSWTLTSAALSMPHMPATGVSGLDLYARTPEGAWRFVGNGRPHQVMNQATFTFPASFAGMRECLLYLPLYNGVTGVAIGAPEGARLEAPAPRPDQLRKPVVVYGTSIAQGGCASRPGMVWSSILGRLLDRPMINLGFSASGTMEPPVGDVLAELDPAAYIIDCLWNMGDFEEAEYTRRVSGLVGSIRQRHPQTPIVFVGQSLIQPEAHPTSMSRKQEAAVLALRDQGVANLVVVDGAGLIGDDGEGTVDGVHLNDIGMERQARALAPVLQDLLQPTDAGSK